MSRSTEEEFTQLVESTAPRILGYLVRRTVPQADAADLLAEVLLVAWRRFDDLPRAEDERHRWLFGVARGVLSNHRRGQSRRVALADRLHEHLDSITSDHAPATEEMIALETALDTLDEADRELLQLIAWEGLSPSEAAGVLGLAPATARQRLHRARERLREAFDYVLQPAERSAQE